MKTQNTKELCAHFMYRELPRKAKKLGIEQWVPGKERDQVTPQYEAFVKKEIKAWQKRNPYF